MLRVPDVVIGYTSRRSFYVLCLPFYDTTLSVSCCEVLSSTICVTCFYNFVILLSCRSLYTTAMIMGLLFDNSQFVSGTTEPLWGPCTIMNPMIMKFNTQRWFYPVLKCCLMLCVVAFVFLSVVLLCSYNFGNIDRLIISNTRLLVCIYSLDV